MSKELHVTMPDGSVWAVPCHVIADNRARYYADTDEDTTYDEEYAYTMGDDYLLRDWAANNMNWSDVSGDARQVLNENEPDFQEGWVNGPKEIVEVDDA